MDANNIEAVAKLLWQAVTSGNWWAIAAAVMAVIVFLLRKYMTKRIPWLGTDRGGVVLTLVGGTAFGVAVGIVGGAPLGAAMVLAAFKVALAGAGGFTALRKFVWPDKAQEFPSLKPTVYFASVSGGVRQADDRNDDPKGGKGDK